MPQQTFLINGTPTTVNVETVSGRTSDGFQVGTGEQVNTNGDTYMWMAWKNSGTTGAARGAALLSSLSF